MWTRVAVEQSKSRHMKHTQETKHRAMLLELRFLVRWALGHKDADIDFFETDGMKKSRQFKKRQKQANTMNLRGWISIQTNCCSQEHFLWTTKGQIHRTRPSRSTSAKILKEDKIAPPIHTEHFHIDGATTLIFVVNGTNAVMRSIRAA